MAFGDGKGEEWLPSGTPRFLTRLKEKRIDLLLSRARKCGSQNFYGLWAHLIVSVVIHMDTQPNRLAD